MKFIFWFLVFTTFQNFTYAEESTKPAAVAKAPQKPKEYPRFIGKFFNGLYYPQINVIEWDDAPRTYYEFHVYQKKDVPAAVDVTFAFKPDVDGPKPKMLINYIIRNRGEILCRHAPIPEHFQKGGFKFFVDRSKPDFDNFMLTMDPEFLVKHMEKKKRKLVEVPIVPYKECKEELTEDDFPQEEKAAPEAAPAPQEAKPAVKKPTGQATPKTENSTTQEIESETNSNDGGIESKAW